MRHLKGRMCLSCALACAAVEMLCHENDDDDDDGREKGKVVIWTGAKSKCFKFFKTLQR